MDKMRFETLFVERTTEEIDEIIFQQRLLFAEKFEDMLKRKGIVH